MTIGTCETLRLLTETANEAAVSVLLSALDSPEPVIQEGALDAILGRRRGAGARALVQRWDRLNERWRQRVSEHARLIAPAVRDAVLSQDARQCANGCAALLSCGEFELIPALVGALQEPDNPHAELVAETLIRICEMLRQSMSTTRPGRRLGDVARVRDQVLPSLERAADRFGVHGQTAVIEGFLLLTSPDNGVLKRIIQDPRHRAYLVVTDLLRHSPRVPIMRLVLNLLESRVAPFVALQVVSHRGDLEFIRQLLQRVANTASQHLRPNLKRIESICWLQGDVSRLKELSPEEQEAAVQLVMASQMDRIEAFGVIRFLMQHGAGAGAGRRAAAAALAQFGGAEANRLALDALTDPDPEVQARAVVQLRERGIPGAISRLIELLESPHDVVRQAAQSCLHEFNFNRYITVFDMMEDDIRRSTGLLVMRVDPSAAEQLAVELKAGTRTRRLRGLAVALAMDAVPQVEPLVIGLLKDDDHFVRSEAARLLAYGNSPLAQQALRAALMDRSVAVREAAEQSLRKLSECGRVTTSGTFANALQRVENHAILRDAEPGDSHASPAAATDG